MKTETFTSLGLDWNLSVPETYEEYDTMAKKPLAALRDAIVQTVYHSTLSDVRARFTEVLDEELTKQGTVIPWESGKKDKEGNDELLSEQAWVNKVLATTGKKIADFAYLIPRVIGDQTITNADGTTTIIKGVNFDPSVSERKSGPPKVSTKMLNSAKDLIKEAGTRTVAIANKLLELNPKAKPAVIDEATGLPTAESLARLIAANEARKNAEKDLSKEYANVA